MEVNDPVQVPWFVQNLKEVQGMRFLVYRQYEARRMGDFSLDDSLGLVRNKLPPDKGYLFDQGSCKIGA